MVICRCPVCNSVTDYATDPMSRIEFDFVDQEIRFVCPKCKKESKMSLLTANKIKDRPLPKMITMRG